MFKPKFPDLDAGFKTNFNGYEVLKGEDGFSPIIQTEKIEHGYKITIIDKENTDTIELFNGLNGQEGPKGDKGDQGEPGLDGKDGYTPVKGVDYFDGKDGKDGANGKDGADGKDGLSATHSWNGTVLTIISANGTSSADLKGEKGDSYVLTGADIQEIVSRVLNEGPVAEEASF